jgi:membrane protease YdiL (CAAX protease family)
MFAWLSRLHAKLSEIDREVAWIFLASVVGQAAFWYFARVPPIEGLTGLDADRTVLPVYLHWAASLATFGLPALLVWRFVLRLPLREMGLGTGDLKLALKGAAVTYVLFATPVVLGGSGMADVGAEYPLSKAAAASWIALAPYSLLYGVYYVAWEIHFRGFMVMGLARKLGQWPAIFAAMVPSVLVHAGKPPGETFGAIFAGLVWGWLAFESRTILGPLLAHWALGITNDVVMSLAFHDL